MSRNAEHMRTLSTARADRIKFGGEGVLIETAIIKTFLSYDSMLFTKFLMLSPNWHTSTIQALDDHCNQFENQFVNNYQ
jgi:hypothetical protein